jgi:ParB family transcriptional regulator, chromosome partitioning protein
MARATPLQSVSPDKIVPNPDNPRLVFREEEMTQLMNSIREVGIKVPISLFQDGSHYVLIDGERRWRCAKRLNLTDLPAIVQPKPTKLENLLMMFNIHNVRLDWDLMPMALKLAEVRVMLEKTGKAADVKAISAITGVPVSTVKRAFDLLDLPMKYQKMLLKEAGKPRTEQKIKPDLFIEIYKSMHAVERYTPEVFEEIEKPEYVEAMVDKYLTGVVDNVVGYRELTKIARAERAGVDRSHAIPTIIRLVKTKSYGIKDAYEDTVQAAYEQRDLTSKVKSLSEKLSAIKSRNHLDREVVAALESLQAEIERLLNN